MADDTPRMAIERQTVNIGSGFDVEPAERRQVTVRLDLIEEFLDGLTSTEQADWAEGVLKRRRVSDIASGRTFFALWIIAEGEMVDSADASLGHHDLHPRLREHHSRRTDAG